MDSQEPNRAISVRRLTDVTETHIIAMAAVLVDCVDGGASVGFMEPLDPAKAQASGVSRPVPSRRAGGRCWSPKTRTASSAPCS